MCRQAIHPVFTDISFNSLRVVQLNIFESFCLTAAKMHHYLKQWGCDVSRHYTFILCSSIGLTNHPIRLTSVTDTITRSIKISWVAHRARLRSHIGRLNNAKCGVGQNAWTWWVLCATSERSHL